MLPPASWLYSVICGLRQKKTVTCDRKQRANRSRGMSVKQCFTSDRRVADSLSATITTTVSATAVERPMCDVRQTDCETARYQVGVER